MTSTRPLTNIIPYHPFMKGWNMMARMAVCPTPITPKTIERHQTKVGQLGTRYLSQLQPERTSEFVGILSSSLRWNSKLMLVEGC